MTYLTLDTWREEWRDWRYTSCPMTKKMNQIGVTMMAYCNSARITKNTEHLRILRKAWEAKFGHFGKDDGSCSGVGKLYSHTMYGCPETVGCCKGKRFRRRAVCPAAGAPLDWPKRSEVRIYAEFE